MCDGGMIDGWVVGWLVGWLVMGCHVCVEEHLLERASLFEDESAFDDHTVR
jgi:hypothetical protein